MDRGIKVAFVTENITGTANQLFKTPAGMFFSMGKSRLLKQSIIIKFIPL